MSLQRLGMEDDTTERDEETGKCAYLVQLVLLSFKLLRFHFQSLGLIKSLLRLRSQLIDAVLGSERFLYKGSLEYDKWL